MKERLLKYIASIERIVAGEVLPEDWEAVLADLLVQIRFFQHERLVHLLVTLLFALLFVGTTLFFSVFPSLPLFALDLLFLLLLVPYIRHYYILENGTQRLYALYDILWKKSVESGRVSRENASRCRGLSMDNAHGLF